MRVAAIREAGKRGVIGEGEHGCARLDTAGNSPMTRSAVKGRKARCRGGVIDVVDYAAGILDCFCYGPDGVAPLQLSCSLVVT